MMQSMPAARVTIPEKVIFKKVGEETVLLDFEAGVYYGLDPVGTRMWELLAEGRSLEDVAAGMTAEYEIDRETLLRDLRNLIDELASRGLVAVEE
jgi:hypothetical protein